MRSALLITAIVLYYDELYEAFPEGGSGIFIPYYSLYESARISNASVDRFVARLEDAKSSSKTIRVSFLTLGFLLVLPAIAMIVIAFYFRPQTIITSGDPKFLFSSQAQDSLLASTPDTSKGQLLVPAPSNAAQLPTLEQKPVLPPPPSASASASPPLLPPEQAPAPPAANAEGPTDLQPGINDSTVELPKAQAASDLDNTGAAPLDGNGV